MMRALGQATKDCITSYPHPMPIGEIFCGDASQTLSLATLEEPDMSERDYQLLTKSDPSPTMLMKFYTREPGFCHMWLGLSINHFLPISTYVCMYVCMYILLWPCALGVWAVTRS
jgi:hypothetical protein